MIKSLRYNQAVRSFFAILQLLLLSLPTFASSFAAVAGSQSGFEASLPACCRRMGTHHCLLTAAHTAAKSGVRMAATPEPCPFAPKALPAAPHAPSLLLISIILFALLLSQPAAVAQTLAKLRISQDRSRQKRGPPVRA